MKVMVTGSNGFLSQNFINKLMLDEKYEQIYCVNRQSGFLSNYVTQRVQEIHANLTNDAWVKYIFDGIKPDIIFHFAANQKKTPEAFLENVSMTSHLLKWCAEGTYFVYASSSAVYGDKGQKELCIEDKTITSPTSLYSSAKLAGEHILGAYQVSGKVKSLTLRYCALVGAGAAHGALPDIITKAQNTPNNLELFGNEPGALKPYTYIADAVSATLHLVDRKEIGIFNVSPDDEISIKEIAESVLKTLQVNKDITWLGEESTPLGDNKIVCMDNTKLKATGWEPKFNTSLGAITQATLDITNEISGEK